MLERMDEMLERPSVDPHGDPIPTATGKVPETRRESLRTCDLGGRVRVARITDQRAEFLQLLERHRLKPGRVVEVLSRDNLAETVEIAPEGGDSLQLGFRAADRVLVETTKHR
jgi:DtxR family Mn-dependent transcriptional regulator